ncbi:MULTISPECIES: hypothetical protein [unclassified Sporosarcina]|nr:MULTISPECIES: hypothetical protein [unclassified Sporosarcina]
MFEGNRAMCGRQLFWFGAVLNGFVALPTAFGADPGCFGARS